MARRTTNRKRPAPRKATRRRPSKRVIVLGVGLLGLSVFMWRYAEAPSTPAVVATSTPPRTLPPAPLPAAAPQAAASVVPKPPPAGSAPAWRRYAVDVGAENGQPMIAIVIDDMGGDHARSERAIQLPAPLTMSFLAYVDGLPALTEAARRHGHELMLHIPMQALSAAADPGPHALTTTLDDDALRRRLDWDLDRLEGIVGANNHMGSRFTEWPHGMEVVEQALHDRGLFVLDSRTTPRTVVIEVADRLGVPHAQRDVFLDDDMSGPAIARELARTEEIARRNGLAIAIGHPHDATLASLQSWLPAASGHGFRLVPVSAIVAHNEALAGREVDVAD